MFIEPERDPLIYVFCSSNVSLALLSFINPKAVPFLLEINSYGRLTIPIYNIRLTKIEKFTYIQCQLFLQASNLNSHIYLMVHLTQFPDHNYFYSASDLLPLLKMSQSDLSNQLECSLLPSFRKSKRFLGNGQLYCYLMKTVA